MIGQKTKQIHRVFYSVSSSSSPLPKNGNSVDVEKNCFIEAIAHMYGVFLKKVLHNRDEKTQEKLKMT